MKKTICMLIAILLFLPVFGMALSAEEEIEMEIEEEEIEPLNACTPTTVWSTRKLTGFLDGQSFYISRFTNTQTGETGFCVQPGINFEPCDLGYSTGVFSSSKNEQIGKITYAFKKLGATDDLYVAAQIMIWEALGSSYSIGGDKGYGYGRALIEKYLKENFKPVCVSLASRYSADYGEVVKLVDENGVLSKRYKVTAEGIDDLVVEDNVITFTMKNSEPFVKKIHIKPKVGYKSTITNSSILFYSDTSQNVYSYQGNFPTEYLPLDIEIVGPTGNLRVRKVDEWERKVDERIELQIFNLEDELIKGEKGWFIEDGELLIEGLLPVGDYYAIELPTVNYKESDEKYYFSITKDEWTDLLIRNINRDVEISYTKKDMTGNDLEGNEFTLYDLDEKGEDILFLRLGKEYDLKELLNNSDDSKLTLSQRYEAYLEDGIFKPEEIGICHYSIANRSGFFFISSDDAILGNADYNAINGKEVFKGLSNHSYIRTVDHDNHNIPISASIDIYGLDGSLLENVRTDSNGLYDISDYREGEYYYIDSFGRHYFKRIEGTSTIYNLKSDRNYLLCESNPKPGFTYHDEACRLINTKDYKNSTYHFINDLRNLNVKIAKNSTNGKLLNGAVFEVEVIDQQGNGNIRNYVSGGVIIDNNGKDVAISGKEERLIKSTDSQVSILDLPEGHYSYVLIDDKERVSKPEEFDIEKGCFSISDLPYDCTIRIKEIKAPAGFKLDNELREYSLKLPYDDLTYIVKHVNEFMIIPPDYDVPVLCTVGLPR